MNETDNAVENKDEATVVNHGDVTEEKVLVAGETFAIKPMKSLPKEYKGLAKQYPNAKGFTEEGSSIALHF